MGILGGSAGKLANVDKKISSEDGEGMRPRGLADKKIVRLKGRRRRLD